MRIIRFNENTGGKEYVLHMDPSRDKEPDSDPEKNRKYDLFCDELFELGENHTFGGIHSVTVYDPESELTSSDIPFYKIDFHMNKVSFAQEFLSPNNRHIWGIVLKDVDVIRWQKHPPYNSKTPFITEDRSGMWAHKGTNRKLYIPVKFNFIDEFQKPNKSTDDIINYYHRVQFTLPIMEKEGDPPRNMTWQFSIFMKEEPTKKYSDLSKIAGKLMGESQNLSNIELIHALKTIELSIMRNEDVANYFRSLVAKAKGQRFDL